MLSVTRNAKASRAPSYFSQFFEEQLRRDEGAHNVRTLYIDRDPATFEDISLHLQGYHVEPRDGTHFVRLFADAQFFSRELPFMELYLGDKERVKSSDSNKQPQSPA